MPKSTVAGHPLHPMLIVAPAALLPFGMIMDAMYRITDDESYADAAYYSLVGGLIGGLAAGVAGAMDYLEVEPGTRVKQTANTHAALNIGALAVTAANVASRSGKPRHKGGSLILSALAAVGVMISGWFGGEMVYEYGMRVRGVSPIGDAPEAKLPGSAAIESLMKQEEKLAPKSGPVLH